MKATYIYLPLLALISAMLVACEQKAPPQTPVPTTGRAQPVTGPEASSPGQTPPVKQVLKLGLVDGFTSQNVTSPLFDHPRQLATADDHFTATPREQRLRFKGRLYTNSDKENYLHSVEGGEVTLELKFE